MSKTWGMPFIGRETELSKIKEIGQQWETRKFVFLSGPGGIGKTRLLDQVSIHLSELDRVRVLEIFDLDDDLFKQPGSIGFAIANNLGREAFENYFFASKELRDAEEQQRNEFSIKQKADEVGFSFARSFNAIAEKERVVIRIDTTDALGDTGAIRYLFEIAANLTNVLIILAGRNADDLYKIHLEKFGEDAVHLELKPFAKAERTQYIAEKQKKIHKVRDINVLEKFFELSEGILVIFDLGIEWLQNHRPNPWMEDISLSQFVEMREQNKETFSKYKEKFNEVIVLPITKRETNFDFLKLVLAVVSPLDIRGIMEILDINRNEALELWRKAEHSTSFKILESFRDDRVKLHDEVERFINSYVWRKLEKEELESYIKSGITLFTHRSKLMWKEIQSTNNKIRLSPKSDIPESLKLSIQLHDLEGEYWALRTKLLQLHLSIDAELGYSFFEEEYAFVSVQSSGANHRRSLLTEIEPYTKFDDAKNDLFGNSFSDDQKIKARIEVAKEAVFDGTYEYALEIYDELLTKVPDNTEQYIETVVGKNNALVRLGKLKESLQNNEKILRLSRQLALDSWTIKLLIETGWTYRTMGNLTEAEQYYMDALRKAIKHDDEERIALIYNSLAYVHALEHQEKAIDEIQQSISMWRNIVSEKEGNRFRLGQALNTAGEVYFELKRPIDALRYFDRSWAIFASEEIEKYEQGLAKVLEWKSKSRSGRGATYWQLALNSNDAEEKDDYVESAIRDLEWAVKYAAPMDHPPILNRLGEAYFLKKLYQKTKEVWDKSMKEAKWMGDAFTEFHSLTDLARLAFWFNLQDINLGKVSDFQSYHNQYIERQKDVEYFVLEGLFFAYLGHLELKNRRIESAVNFYLQSFPRLEKYGTYSPFNLMGQLDFIEENLLGRLPDEQKSQFINLMTESWVKKTDDIVVWGYFRRWERAIATGGTNV